MDIENFVGIPGYGPNQAQHEANVQSFERMALLAATALIARVTMNVGGKILCFVFDKVKKAWIEEQPKPLDYAVETFQLSGTASLLASPSPTEEISTVEKDEENMQKDKFVAKEVERLNKQNEQKDEAILDLKQRNEVQQRMIVALPHTPQSQQQPRPAPPPQPTAQVDDNLPAEKAEDALLTKRDPWGVGAAVKKFADHIREEEAKGNTVYISDINIVNNNIVHNWGKLLREELGRADNQINQTTKVKTLQDVKMASNNDKYNIPKDKIKPTLVSPRTGSSSNDSIYGGDMNNLARENKGNGDGGESNGGGSPGDPNGNGSNTVHRRWNIRDDGDDRKRREFLLVKSSNINITIFAGFNLNKNPFIPFNKAIRKLILTQGGDGEELLKILDSIEIYGEQKFTNTNLRALSEIYPKAYEYARAVNAALLNWTEGAAQGLVEHGCDNGLDAWRRLYNRYIPGADDLQNLLMEELMLLKPVTEQEIDTLFIEVERIMEWYIKADSKGESMNTKWVRAALIKHLPKTITQQLAVQLRQAQTIDSIYNLVMIYLHDHNTGLPRGQTPAKLYLTEGAKEAEDQPRPDDKREENRSDPTAGSWHNTHGEGSGDLDAVKGGKTGKGKGYGACWHCGEWGHPRRECLQLKGAGKDSVNALQGKGKGYKGKGKGSKGYKGKGYKGNNWSYKGGYRSPGKAIGKGLKYYSNDDYNEAWGNELYNYEYGYDSGNWGYDSYGDGYIGNVTMLLEKGKCKEGVNKKDKKLEGKLGKRDECTGRQIPKPVKLQNSFGALQNEDDDDEKGDNNDDDEGVAHITDWRLVKRKVNLNRKQRMKKTLVGQNILDDYNVVQEAVESRDSKNAPLGVSSDAEARDSVFESGCIEFTTTTTTTTRLTYYWNPTRLWHQSV